MSQIVLAGQVSDRFCGNGIAPCDVGSAWSFGETNSYSCPGMPFPGSPSAPNYPVTYLDGGPDGAFCCDLGHEYAAVDAAADAGADASTDGGLADAVAE